jgi:membrane protein implicated in regulation of membrane protease activity
VKIKFLTRVFQNDANSQNSTYSFNRSNQLNNRATVVTAMQPGQIGRIKFQATYWFGFCEENLKLQVGDMVEVLDRDGNTLIVKPVQAERQESMTL